jgi:hypothetical protein
MNKKQIIRELRRSAMEDELPYYGLGDDASVVAARWSHDSFYHSLSWLTTDEFRLFLLFVAEALEHD